MSPMLVAAFTVVTFIIAGCQGNGSAHAAEEYALDPAHTHVQFSVNRFGFNAVIGGFNDVSGVITLDQDKPESSFVNVRIETASLTSGDATRDEHVRGVFWLNVGEFPAIEFKSNSVALTADNEAVVTGALTMLGVTKPVTLNVRLNKLGTDPATKKDAVGFSATGILMRSDFGLETALKLVGDEVAIRIETLAHRVE